MFTAFLKFYSQWFNYIDIFICNEAFKILSQKILLEATVF